MSIPSIPDIMTVEEFATYLRVSAKTVRRIIASGELAVIRVHSMTRITREAVAAYLTDQTRKTTQCPQQQSQKANARKTASPLREARSGNTKSSSPVTKSAVQLAVEKRAMRRTS
jgi:excisionase family DNA binding protein